MNKDEVLIMAKELGALKWNHGGRSIVINCPLAPWTHGKSQEDRKPSCSIFPEEEDMSSYNCFTCHYHGTVVDLVWRVNRFREGGLEKLLEWVRSVNKPDLAVRLDRAISQRVGGDFEPPKTRYRVFEETEMSGFSEEMPDYILKRGFEKEACKMWGLGYDNSLVDPRIVFPVRDFKRNLVGMVGRTIRDNYEPKYKNYWGFQKSQFLYGEHLLEYDSNKPFILVEGMLDPIGVKQALDVDCVAQMGTYISKEQAEKIIGYCGVRPLILCYDADTAGKDSEDRARDLFRKRIVIYTARLPEGTDPAELAIKQPEVLKRAIKEAS